MPVSWNGARGIVSITRDITVQKKAEDALRQSETDASRARQQLMDAIEAIPDGFVLFDRNDRLVLCNSNYKKLYLKIADQIRIGATLEEIVKESVNRSTKGESTLSAEDREKLIEDRMRRHRQR